MNHTSLIALAGASFHDLTSSEKALLRMSQDGDLVPPITAIMEDPSYDPNAAESWDENRNIRPLLIRWLCSDQDAVKLVDPRGIQTYAAKIEYLLDLSYIKLPFPLTFWRCRFLAPLDLHSAEMPELDLQGSRVRSVQGDRLHIGSNLFLRRGFQADEGITLAAAQIGGDLSLIGSKLLNPPRPNAPNSGVALKADRIAIRGSAFLRDKFYADGDARLVGAQIGGDLDCSGASFHGEVNAAGASIKGRFLWSGISDPERASLRLTDASADFVGDEKKSWPPKGHLRLDGLNYRRCETSISVADRMEWLTRTPAFRPQPYRQLAKALKEAGDEDGARRILAEMERRAHGDNWYEQPWSCALRWTIGYGYYPERALWGLTLLTGLSWIIFRRAHLAKRMMPTDKDACQCFKDSHAVPPNYPRFSPFMFAAENSLPLVKFGQADKWQPNHTAAKADPKTKNTWINRLASIGRSPVFLQRFIWFQILIGWILATFFLAGLTGIVQK